MQSGRTPGSVATRSAADSRPEAWSMVKLAMLSCPRVTTNSSLPLGWISTSEQVALPFTL